MLEDGIRVLIYAGDVDFICNWMGNKAWTQALNWSGKTDFNAAQDYNWEYGSDKTIGGKIRQADAATGNGGLTFMQVCDYFRKPRVPCRTCVSRDRTNTNANTKQQKRNSKRNSKRLQITHTHTHTYTDLRGRPHGAHGSARGGSGHAEAVYLPKVLLEHFHLLLCFLWKHKIGNTNTIPPAVGGVRQKNHWRRTFCNKRILKCWQNIINDTMFDAEFVLERKANLFYF